MINVILINSNTLTGKSFSCICSVISNSFNINQLDAGLSVAGPNLWTTAAFLKCQDPVSICILAKSENKDLSPFFPALSKNLNIF